MNLKKSLENRVRGWLPKEPFPKTAAKIDFKLEQRASKNRLAPGLVGGILTILIATGYIFLGVIFSGALRNYGFYATGERNPQLIALQNYALGSAGLVAGIFGFVGSRIGKSRGGILLIIAGVVALAFFFLGILPSILMIITGANELGKKQSMAPKEPSLPGKFATFIARLKSIENVAIFAFPTAAISIVVFFFSSLVSDAHFLIYYFSFMILILPPVRALRRKHALNSVFSKIFLANSTVFSLVSLILLDFSIINSIGYVTISLVTISIFTLLYAWVERPSNRTKVASKGSKSILKFICTLFAVAGIVFLVFSLSLTSHVEARLSVVNHSEALFRRGVFYLNESIPDSTVSANLTTRDTLIVNVMVAQIFGFPREYSSIDLTISQNSSAGAAPVIAYKLDNITSAMPDPVLYWSVPQSGTYDITFHYNYNGTAAVEESVVNHWSASEPVPTTIYTPLLGLFSSPVLAFSSILLFISIAIPIHRLVQ